MPVEIHAYNLGALENNSYLLVESSTGQAIVVDPSFDPAPMIDDISRNRWTLQAIWLTHAHFDHLAGVNALISTSHQNIPLALHPADLPLLRERGGARLFGFQIPPIPEPSLFLSHLDTLPLGNEHVQVRHTPGHSPGHVVFHLAGQSVVFCGDLIFYRGVGRTDLPGSNGRQLVESIRTQIYTLPPETRLLSGHGPETTVGDEMRENPFVSL